MEAPEPGLSTVDALRILHSDLQEELKHHKLSERKRSWKTELQQSFLHYKHVDSVFHCTSLALLVTCALLLFLAFLAQEPRHGWLAVQCFGILLIASLTLYLLSCDDRLKKTELYEKTKRVLQVLEECIKDDFWTPSDFVSLHSPLSPCISLQWTARDGNIVNLPCAFLVEGDIIYLRPGQVVLMDCQELNGSSQFKTGDIYNPSLENDNHPDKSSSAPRAQVPWKPIPFVAKETPFVRNLRLLLKDVRRPNSMLNNERYQIYTLWVERRVVIMVFALTLLTNVLRYVFLGKHVGHWAEMCLSIQVQSVLPLTPLVYPLLWKLMDMYGTSRLVSLFLKSRDLQMMQTSGFESSSTLEGAAFLVQDHKDVFKRLCHVLRGTSDVLPRTCNFLHVLGSVTSLCCVDKKGVLSWPNPTIEKVFFLTSSTSDTSDNSSDSGSSQSCGTSHSDNNIEEEIVDEKEVEAPEVSTPKLDLDYIRTNFQVLDVTQDTQNHLTFNFDDPNWKKFVTSLKPIGLNILLNTCSMDTTEKYTQFADHVTCASHKHEVSIPVVNRRCFCELAHQIGFNQAAAQIFKTQRVLGLVRHVTPDRMALDCFIRTKSHIKHRLPMPHVFSVAVQETNSGMHQLFSQGTADLLLDACSEFWNGTDLCRLTDVERKKISDFYHRTSMSSYCTAFSYRPVSQGIVEDSSDLYIEVPEDAEDLFPSLRSPVPSRSWDTQSLDSRLQYCGLDYSHSSYDSFTVDSSSSPMNSVLTTFQEQCNQIFIGMVSMQYQAKQDVVDLIENLESACIRFVHFSKENELRSRVFSEKMGLEAGWNCHISLLGEDASEQRENSPSNQNMSHNSSNRASKYSSRQSTDSGPLLKSSGDSMQMKVKASQEYIKGRRCSAPGAISLDTTQVKFEVSPSPQSQRESISRLPNGHDDTTENTDSAGQRLLADDKQVKNKTSRMLFRGSSCQEQGYEVGSIVASKANLGDPAQSDLQQDDNEPETCSVTEEVLETDVLLSNVHGVSSESLPASSFVTENTDSVTGALGLTNRAKLPKGIKNIRPHLENVDNVPLLVSLLTDCTPDTTREMFSILQEHGEVVCCLGSSANIHNTALFLQADCSLSVEPLYPQICMRQSQTFPPSTYDRVRPQADMSSSESNAQFQAYITQDNITPMYLNALLHSIPCSLSFCRNDNIAIIRLIALARHHCQQMRHMFLFLLMCQLTVCLLHTLCALVLLPPSLAPHHTLWLVLVVLPLLSLTIMGNPIDLLIVKMAQGKNKDHLSYHSLLEFAKYYLIRYLPSVLVCLVCHSMTLTSFCHQVSRSNETNSSSCHFLFGDTGHEEASQWNGWYTDYHTGLVLSQNIVACQLVLYFACGSVCFIHRLKQLWEESPLTNRLWCLMVPLLFMLQVIYFALNVALNNSSSSEQLSIGDVPIATWVLAVSWALLLIPLHELTKRKEAKTWKRYQKRARLDFGTKLGMNSPF